MGLVASPLVWAYLCLDLAGRGTAISYRPIPRLFAATFHNHACDEFAIGQLPDTLVTTRSLHFDLEPDDAVQQDAIPRVQPTNAAEHALNIRGKIVRQFPQQFLNRYAEVVGQLGGNR